MTDRHANATEAIEPTPVTMDTPRTNRLSTDEDAPEEGRQHHPSQLDELDLDAFFSADGPLAAVLEGYEVRPSQIQMAHAVKGAIQARATALIEAPTGTGKSIAYLLPALLSGRTVVVATANKSLQNQLFTKDIPFLAQVLDRPIDAVMVKGRSNYLCNYKWEKEAQEQARFALFEGEDDQIIYLRQWVDETETGDVDDLPFEIHPTVRPHVVSFPDDCLQRDCRYYFDGCFVNRMRDRAANAQVLITNHHLLLNALELGEMGTRLLPDASIYVIDEAHQLESTATSVFEVEVTNYTLEQLLNRSVFKEHVDAERLDDLRLQNSMAFTEVEHLSDGNSFRIEVDLEEMKKLGTQLKRLQEELKQRHPYKDLPDKNKDEEAAEQRAQYDLALEALGSLVAKIQTVATSSRDDKSVRYMERVYDRRHVRVKIHAAPIDPANYLSEFLFESNDRTVICTSATLATNGHFNHFKQRCGVFGDTIDRILPAVFDYPKQTMLYQPALPSYDWRNKERYYDAVAQEIERLLEVSRGRALCLFTNWSGLQQVRTRLEDPDHGCIWPLRAQGEYARNALLQWFVETPHSVLLATRSFWEGVDLPGEDLSLVVLDKMPFPTPNDPLHSARMQRLDQADDANSFGDYMLPLMTLTLKQGFGRLVRRSTDRGVVAILDERLSSKGYGRQTRTDLPPARFSRTFREIHEFYRQSLGSRADFALNVRAWPDDSALRYRWQLLRLQDGRSDGRSGRSRGTDRVAAEITTAIDGLQDLKKRIDSARRKPHSFGVELRCSVAAKEALEQGDLSDSLRKQWVHASSIWGSFEVIGLPDEGKEPVA